MRLLVDTSVWSLALRRDEPDAHPEVERLKTGLADGAAVFTTGLVLQEVLQGLRGPKQRAKVIEKLSCLPFVVPNRADHVAAAELRDSCRRKGVQVPTIDALLSQLCIRHRLALLTADVDFERIAGLTPLRLA